MARKSEASARVYRSRERPLGDDDDDDIIADFQRTEPAVLRHAREAVMKTITFYGQGDPLQLASTVIVGLFVDLCIAMPGRRGDIVGAVNTAIAGAGLQLVPRK